MAKYFGSKFKLIRREGIDLYLKSGQKFIEEKCRTNYLPGQHKNKRPKISTFLKQLRAKQKVVRYYNISTNQLQFIFKKYKFCLTHRYKSFLSYLELRLDSIVYYLNFASTRAEAKQLINHKFIKLNNNICTSSSFITKPFDNIRCLRNITLKVKKKIPSWLQIQNNTNIGYIKRLPKLNEIYKNYLNVF